MKFVFTLPNRWITTGTYVMVNGRKATIDSVKPNGQGVGSYEGKPDAMGRIRKHYWVGRQKVTLNLSNLLVLIWLRSFELCYNSIIVNK
jgi:hypothetical protein